MENTVTISLKEYNNLVEFKKKATKDKTIIKVPETILNISGIQLGYGSFHTTEYNTEYEFFGKNELVEQFEKLHRITLEEHQKELKYKQEEFDKKLEKEKQIGDAREKAYRENLEAKDRVIKNWDEYCVKIKAKLPWWRK